MFRIRASSRRQRGGLTPAAGPTGTEALKNLVLGGIAAFTVVDGADVTAGDLGNNFMVEAPDLGRKRAAAVAGPLRELNDSVAGACVEEDAMALLDAHPRFFHGFTLVIATQARRPGPAPTAPSTASLRHKPRHSFHSGRCCTGCMNSLTLP